MATTAKARIVFTGTHDWYEIVDRNGELELAENTFPARWEEAAEAAGLDVEDTESFATAEPEWSNDDG